MIKLCNQIDAQKCNNVEQILENKLLAHIGRIVNGMQHGAVLANTLIKCVNVAINFCTVKTTLSVSLHLIHNKTKTKKK